MTAFATLIGASLPIGCGRSTSRTTDSTTTDRLAIDSGHVTVDGGALYYERAGNGPTVILLHGGNLDRRMWDDQFILLSRDYDVVRYDARGFGRAAALYRSHPVPQPSDAFISWLRHVLTAEHDAHIDSRQPQRS